MKSGMRSPIVAGRTRKRARFLVDGMLGTLATKLRILGFDSVYDKTSSDSKLIEQAAAERRHLLTSDVDLFLLARRRGLAATLIASKDEAGRLVEVCSSLRIPRLIVPRVSRCSSCNGRLSRMKTKTRLGETMHICESCGKTYWKGAHWRKLYALFNDVNVTLEGSEK